MSHADDRPRRLIDVFEQVRHEHRDADRHGGRDPSEHERAPAPLHQQAQCLIQRHGGSDHERDERAHEQADRQQDARQQVDCNPRGIARLLKDQQRRKTQCPRRGVVRLIQEQALQPVHLEAAELPVADAVDVQVAQARQRDAALPEDVELLRALEAREEDRKHAADRSRPRAPNELPHEGVEERHEREPSSNALVRSSGSMAIVWARDVRWPTRGWRASSSADDPRPETVLRRDVALRDLFGDGHRPREVRDEVGAVGLAFRAHLADARVGSRDDRRHNQEDEQQGCDITTIVRGLVEPSTAPVSAPRPREPATTIRARIAPPSTASTTGPCSTRISTGPTSSDGSHWPR